MHPYPSPRHLHYLLTVAETGHFSEAARACHVTQSTLSAGLRALEDQLGQTLIDRSARRACLTPAGERVAQSAQTILNESASLLARVQDMDRPLTGPLKLGILPTIAPYMLPAILPGLHDSYPDMQLRLYEDLTDRLLNGLRDGQLDAALLALPCDTRGMHERVLFDESFVLAGLPEKLPSKQTITLDDIDRESILLLEDGHCLRDHALEACKLKPPQEVQTFSATSLPTLLRMVEHGYGLTLLPEMAATPEALPARVAIQRFVAPAPSRRIGLLWRTHHPRAGAFDQLAQSIAAIYTHNAQDSADKELAS
jgi:LysR family hydrogen peroxide-inducible transcriptional activator